MYSFFMDLITIVAVIITFVKCRQIKDKPKKIILFMTILLTISTFHNRSIYWLLYWDGPYYGQVVDADTGEPIEDAAVAADWDLEHNILYLTSMSSDAGAKETVTDKDGKFILPVNFAFTIWPFSDISIGHFWVFKPGYDTSPPSIYSVWPDEERDKFINEHRWKFIPKRRIWRKFLIRLKKAKTLKERQRAWSELKHRASDFKNLKKMIKEEERELKALIRKEQRKAKTNSNNKKQ